MLKKMFENKRTVLTAASLALIALAALASAIEQFSFHPARRLSREEVETVGAPIHSIVENIADIPLEKQIAFLVTLLLLFVLVIVLLPPEMRKRLLKQILRFTLGGLLLLYLFKLKPDLLEGLFPIFNMAAGQNESPAQGESAPPPVFEPPQVSGWVSFLIAFGVVLLAMFIFWRVNRWLNLRKPPIAAPLPLNKIADAARASLLNLSADGFAQDKIIQCYADMSRVVDMRRGVSRDHAMTPAEFALRLENAGLPREPVNRLTRLFESVRYGARASAQSDVDEAVACLKSILKYCGEIV